MRMDKITSECNVKKVSKINNFASHLGSLVPMLKTIIERKLPKDYIKSYYIDTRMGALEFIKATSKDNEGVHKKELPIMAISPKIEVGSSSTLAGDMSLTYSRTNGIYKDLKTHYIRVFNNEQDYISVWCNPKRHKMTFEIAFKVRSYMEAVDLAKVIYFKEDRKEFHNDAQMSFEIPNEIIATLAAQKKLDITDKTDVDELDKYLNTFSNRYIHRIINPSSNRSRYAFFFKENLLLNCENPPEIDVNKNDKIVDYATVRMTLSLETHFPDFYLMVAKDDVIYDDKDFDKNMTILEEENKVLMNMDFSLIPKSTLGNKSILMSIPYTTDISNEPADILEFKGALTNEITEVIEVTGNLACDDYFDIILIRDGQPVKKEFYEIDWNEFKIYNKEQYRNYTYKLLLYGDLKYINEVLLGAIEPDLRATKDF